MKSNNLTSSKHYCSFLKITFLLISLLVGGCKKLVEVDAPIQSLTAQNVYNNNATAASVLTGIYINMSSQSIFSGQSSIAIGTGLSADELIPVTPQNSIFTILYSNSLTTDDHGYWGSLYSYVFRVNAAIEGLSASSGISAPVKQQLLGEAKFLRAYFYFNLVNLYGDVPLLLTTDIKANSSPSRTEKLKVYAQIIQDLKEAQIELSDNYFGSDAQTPVSDRVRPNRAVATGLLSKVYLYNQQWALAETEATKLISDAGHFQLESLNNTFLSDSKEAIWQLQPVSLGYSNTEDGVTFILASNGAVSGPDPNTRPVYLSKNLLAAFEQGDNRKSSWVDSVSVSGVNYPYPFKYKQFLPSAPRTEFLMMFRLAEQYLIRAEARAQLGKLTGNGSALEDINIIRTRAGLGNSKASSLSGILNAILQERKVELFTESGNRWYDLKRTDKIDEVMTPIAPGKGGIWAHFKALYPIPISDIKNNPNLKGHQNPGYPEQ